MKLSEKKEEKLIELLNDACESRDYKTAEKMIKKLKKGNSAELQGGLESLLGDAVVNKDAEWVEVFLKNGANPNANLRGHDMPILAWAAMYDDVICKMLVEFGADVNAKSPNGETALMLVAQEFYHDEALRYLIENGADVNLANNEGKTAVMYALDRGNFSGFNVLAENGADLQAKDEEGKGTLDYGRKAVESGELKDVDFKEVEQRIAGAEVKEDDKNQAEKDAEQKSKEEPKAVEENIEESEKTTDDKTL